ncbi:oxoglutarate-dependent flavonoid 7-O-demethylase 1-like [Coffea arabica]|uniref:Oxoglutarate-dependent flavonoid 7-O-demethylase 1-like n=1 Tax=Coffea arabica TaxID=13443 RepID=A0A6P6U7X4_COFAR
MAASPPKAIFKELEVLWGSDWVGWSRSSFRVCLAAWWEGRHQNKLLKFVHQVVPLLICWHLWKACNGVKYESKRIVGAQAEARSLLVGVNLCLQRGIAIFDVEMDSLTLVRILNRLAHCPWGIHTEVQQLMGVASSFPRILHCYRQANQVADTLANTGWIQWIDTRIRALKLKRTTIVDPKTRKLGGSLNVPFVQELAKKNPFSVPTRYIRPDKDQYSTISNSSAVEVSDLELQKLHSTCKEWGFFHNCQQLINHGVSSSLVEKLKSEVQNFFNLPMVEKNKYGQEPGDVEGYGQAFVKLEEQKLDWADVLYMITQPEDLRKPHLFPKLPLPLRETLDQYSRELKILAIKVLEQMTKALGMKLEDMTMLFQEGMQSMRMNYYPPCPQPELVMGLCPHSDAVGLTILLQVNEVEALQIKKAGAWVPVVPLPNAFIVNVGDILEIVTNGIYKSVEHRATVNLHNKRLSIATFFSPKLDGYMGPAPSLITPKNPAIFRRISMIDYLKAFFSRELDGKSFIDAMRTQIEDF